jgi:hypothetical protein
MTRTVFSRFLVALHVVATLALCAVAAQMFVIGFGVIGEVHDLFSNAPLVRSVPTGWNPAVSLAGTNELASFAAFPGGPALLVLGIYLSYLEHAGGTSEASRRRASVCLPVLGLIWSIAAAGFWAWSLQIVRAAGYIPTHAGTVSGLVFVAALLCLAGIVHIHGREAVEASSLNENAPA